MVAVAELGEGPGAGAGLTLSRVKKDFLFKEWNAIPLDTRNSESVGIFKCNHHRIMDL